MAEAITRGKKSRPMGQVPDMTYPTSWGSKPDTPDELSATILLVVANAGNTITYKEAAMQIDEIVRGVRK